MTLYKKKLQNVKWNVKQRCIFYLILVGVPSSLILWRRRCGWRVFYLLEKFCVKHISLTKAICWESLHSHTDVKMIGSAVTEKSSFKVWGFFSSKMNWVLTLPLLLKMSVGKLEPWLILKGFSSSEVEIYLYNSKAYTALYEILFSCLGWCPQFLDMLNKLQKQVLLGYCFAAYLEPLAQHWYVASLHPSDKTLVPYSSEPIQLVLLPCSHERSTLFIF